MYTRIFLAARNHFIYIALRSFEEFWGVLTHNIQTLKCDVVSFGVIARSVTTKQSRTLYRVTTELVIFECVIFCAGLCKNTLRDEKYAFNQMVRICRERERDLWIAYFSSFFPLKLCCLHSNSITVSFHKSTAKIKALLWSKVCKKNDRLKWTVFRLFFYSLAKVAGICNNFLYLRCFLLFLQHFIAVCFAV